MKRYLKLFLVFLCIIISLIGSTCNANYILPQKEITVSQNTKHAKSILLNFYVLNDTSIAASNNHGYEISALKSDVDDNYRILENIGSGDISRRKYLKRYYLNVLSYCYQNILSVIKNEIYVRAP